MPWWSPTTLQGLDISHFDFYRFNDPREWEDAGFREIFAAPGLKLAEWPEKAAGMLPVADLRLHIEPLDDDRGRCWPKPARARPGAAGMSPMQARQHPTRRQALRRMGGWPWLLAPARPGPPRAATLPTIVACGCGRRGTTRASPSNPTRRWPPPTC
jgi:hypothetical protein